MAETELHREAVPRLRVMTKLALKPSCRDRGATRGQRVPTKVEERRDVGGRKVSRRPGANQNRRLATDMKESRLRVESKIED